MSLTGRQFKSSIYEQFARVGKMIASPRRHEILDLLSQGEHTVEDLARKSGMTVANASQHLQVLRSGRFVEARKDGTYVYYRLAGFEVSEFLLLLRRLAESRLTEIEKITGDFLAQHGAFEPVSQDELIERALSGEVTVLDVRPQEEYTQGHLPGAESIPLTELPDRLSDLPSDREVVAYCRGPYCVLAVEAIKLLREAGFQAARLEAGVPDFKAREIPIHMGAMAH